MAHAPAPSPAAPDEHRPLLEVCDLAVSFDRPGGDEREPFMAVDGASFSVFPRQTLAIVGESGCGKSVTALSALRLLPSPPARIQRGFMHFAADHASVDLLALSPRDIRRIRGSQIAMIFQEPMTSLNPVLTIGEQILEAILLHQHVDHAAALKIAEQAMLDVGIADPRRRLDAYPHQFSGGMRQRVMIAMALACRPRLLIADEPTTALDVTIQAQILDLLRDLQRTRGMGILLITHALGVVAENADVVCVMYAGKVVEYASVLDLFDRPLHPYTRGLLASIPSTTVRRDRLITVAEMLENPAQFDPAGASGPLASRAVAPWWPTRTPPADTLRTDRGASSTLCEVEPNHWVALWTTPAAAKLPARPPSLDFRLDRSHSCAPRD